MISTMHVVVVFAAAVGVAHAALIVPDWDFVPAGDVFYLYSCDLTLASACTSHRFSIN